jgi:hypothetical protein
LFTNFHRAGDVRQALKQKVGRGFEQKETKKTKGDFGCVFGTGVLPVSVAQVTLPAESASVGQAESPLIHERLTSAMPTAGVWTFLICGPKWPKKHSPGFNGAKIREGFGLFSPRKVRRNLARFQPRTPTQAGTLCYIAFRRVERPLEMLPDGSTARPQPPTRRCSVA